MMLGPSLGGIMLLFNLNVSQLLYIDSASYFISAICIYFIKFPKKKVKHDQKASLIKDTLNGLKFMSIGDKKIGIMLTAFASQLLIGAGVIQFGIPKVLELNAMSTDRMFGFTMSVIAFSASISSIWLSKRNVKRPAIWIFTGYGLRGLAFFLLGFAQGITAILIAALIIGFAATISGTTLTTLLQSNTPSYMLGKVMAVRSSIGNISDAFAYLIVGSILSLTSLTVSFIIFTVYVLFTTSLFSYLWIRNTK